MGLFRAGSGTRAKARFAGRAEHVFFYWIHILYGIAGINGKDGGIYFAFRFRELGADLGDGGLTAKQGSGIRGQGSVIRDQGSGTEGLRDEETEGDLG